jgi:hypothetical protein
MMDSNEKPKMTSLLIQKALHILPAAPDCLLPKLSYSSRCGGGGVKVDSSNVPFDIRTLSTHPLVIIINVIILGPADPRKTVIINNLAYSLVSFSALA